MGGYSVECDCGKWFVLLNAYKDHCKATGHKFYINRVGSKPKGIDNLNTTECLENIKYYANKIIKECPYTTTELTAKKILEELDLLDSKLSLIE